jgi:hypothetical protein
MDSVWQEHRLTVAIAALFSLFWYFALQALSSKKLDPREPPVIPPTIPYVGHLIGMGLSGSRYFKNLQ